jgi:hypothetical protein
VLTYIECLGRAAYCCKLCAKTEDCVSKDGWRRKMLDCCAEAEIDMKDFCSDEDDDQEKARKLHLFLLFVYDVCSTCEGKEALVCFMAEKEWINPHVAELNALERKKKEGRKKKKKSATGKLVVFDFINRMRL